MLRTFILVCLISYSHEYNVELNWSYVLSNPHYMSQGREAYFGYSVSLFTSDYSSWVLVGAPRANDTELPGSDVVERGAVYLCELPGTTTPCRQLLVTEAFNGAYGGSGDTRYYTLQDYGWLGGSLDLRPENPGSVIVSCSPRWINQMVFSYNEEYFLNGACYLTSISEVTSSGSASKPWNIVTPLTDIGQQRIPDENGVTVYNYQLAQGGVSAHVTQNSDEVWLGAPGLLQWKGSVVTLKQSFLVGGGSGWSSTDSKVFKPVDSAEWNDYFGYSIGSDRFFGSETHMVAGSPRDNLMGKVSVFSTYSDRIQVRWEASGPQIGCYFGAAIATGDVTKDGLSELFVGAPLYSSGSVTESGLVIIYSRKFSDLEEGGRLTGSGEAGARFGSSLMVVGDLDLDGYNDLAVGAPYEGEGAGAVYIYHGSAEGLLQTFSQKIMAGDVFSSLKGFGISISRGVDVDGNRYSDFAVGAHEGIGSAIVLRTRPVMKLSMRVSLKENILTEMDKPFYVESCVSYEGFNVLNKIDATVIGLIDDGVGLPRAIFVDSGTARLTYFTDVTEGSEECFSQYVQFQEKVQDYTRPLKLSFEVLPPPYDPDCERCGVIVPGSSSKSIVHIPLKLGCGPDAECNPELDLAVKWEGDSKLPLRSDSRVTLSIVVTVKGSDQSYLGAVKVLLPEGLTAHLPLPYSCSQSGEEVSCDLPNPMAVGDKEELQISVKQRGDLLAEGEVPLKITCSADGAQDVEEELILSVIEDVKLDLSVYSENDLIQYSPPPSPIPATKLMYQIINRGLTSVNEVRLDTIIPTTYDDVTFAQLTQQPTSSSGTSECSLQDSLPDLEPEGDVSDPPHQVSVKLVCGQHSQLTCRRVLCVVRQIHLSPIITIEVAYNTTIFAERLSDDATIGFYTTAAASYGTPTPSVYKESSIWTILTPADWQPPPKSAPAWPYVVAVFAGILILALIVLICVKIGFFKRKRPEQKPEEEGMGGEEEEEGWEDVTTPLNERDNEEGMTETTAAIEGNVGE